MRDRSRLWVPKNLRHLGRCFVDRVWLTPVVGPGRAGLGPYQGGMIFGLVSLKLTFLISSRLMLLLRLASRETWWKDAEIYSPRTQLGVAM